MLSIRAFSSGGAAAKYYSHGDYYGQEGQGTWLGEGAKELGLKGDFTASSDQNFNSLLTGILPDGQVLGRKTKEGIEHRPGIDLTFSAPKSFSIEMLVFAHKEQKADMEKALMNATSKTLSYIEKKGYAVARKGKDGYEKEPINKLSFASFYHTTNRNLEPQAHVHCFLANAAKCSDDKYRSLEFKDILKNNKFLGQVFRNELALEVKKLGLDINTKFLSDGSSSFELSHIDQKLIDVFSTRRAEIEALCKIYGVTTKEGRDKIVINSRKAKQTIKEEDLKKSWNDIASNVQKEIDLDKINKNLQQESHKTTKTTSINELQSSENSNITSVQSVIEKISQFFTKSNKTSSQVQNQESTNTQDDKQNKTEAHWDKYYLKIEDLSALCIEDVNSRKSVFTEKELAGRTLKYAIGNYGINDIEKELKNQEKAGILIKRGELFTTKKLLSITKTFDPSSVRFHQVI